MSFNDKNQSKDSKAPASKATRRLAEGAASEGANRKPRITKLFEVNSKSADGSVLPVTPRRPQRSWRIWGLALLAVGCIAFWTARAQQQPDTTPEQTTEPMPAEDASQTAAPMETEDANQTNQPASADDLAGTNSPSQTDTSSANSSSRRSRRSYRRRSGSGNSGSSYGSSGVPQSANGRADFTNFNVIVKNNIFDPNRRPGREYVPTQRQSVREVESFALKGTASLGDDNFAVFDGSSSEYHKAARVSDSIASYKVAAITPDLVKLANGTNQVELRVGMRMRREAEGPWTRSDSSESYASAATSSANTSSTSGAAGATNVDPSGSSGEPSEILKKLMKAREQE
jgi:hypothetical protein